MNNKLLKQIKAWILFVMFAIAMSGITAFPLESELQWLDANSSLMPQAWADWTHRVYEGVKEVNATKPYFSYGTDWLAFAHLVIAMAFIGVLKDPVRNRWVVDWGILSCFAVIPLAFIAGPIRDIPFFHQLVDISFGLLGLIPLFIIRSKIQLLRRQVEAVQT